MDAIPSADQVGLAWKLYSAHIITEKTLEKVQEQPGYERSSTILEAVRKAVNAEQERLLEFVTILEQEIAPLAGVAAKIRRDMSEFLFLHLILLC